MAVQSPSEWQSDTAGTYLYFTKPIQKSPQDDREYRLIRLENGLEAMLVHDAEADVAAANLNVSVGFLQDPVGSIALGLSCGVLIYLALTQDDMPGLAHFCEHLLFLVNENMRNLLI